MAQQQSQSRARSYVDEQNKTTGHFERKPSVFRNWVRSDPTSEFPAERDRYHLYVSYACPWASRTLAFRALKGLDDVIPVHCVAPVMATVDQASGSRGWVFAAADDPEIYGVKCNDPLYGSIHLRALYERSDPGYSGKYTVPVLWDSKTQKIVNNESSEIIRMLNDEFNAFARHPQVNLTPNDQSDEIAKLNDWMYDTINNGVYRCGFATTQAAYEEAFHKLFAALDHAEELLSNRRFLGGNQPNESDIRLFVTIIRFDPVYVGHFKCNKKRIVDYPNLWGWVRDVYQWPTIASTVNLDHIKHHYYESHLGINPTRVVPVGPDIDYNSAHGREALSK